MDQPSWQLGCPVPVTNSADRITLAHGEGGRTMRRLIEERILPRFRDSWLGVPSDSGLGVPSDSGLGVPSDSWLGVPSDSWLGVPSDSWLGVPSENGQRVVPGDAALLPGVPGKLAFTSDSFVVTPLFFPGGDIGRLSVLGTVNDLIVAGARPLWLSLSLIIEEGLPLAVLDQVLDSIASAAREAAVRVVTGDTKVVPRGAADGLFINTSGIGQAFEPAPPGPDGLVVGDILIISGPIGRHGIAILAAREQLGLTPPPETDCACLWEPVRYLRGAGLLAEPRRGIRAMRDATRGGVTAVLHEWAEASGHTLTINEAAIPLTPVVRGASELLGLDPLHIANEGIMVIAASPDAHHEVLSALQQSTISCQAAVIGEVRPRMLAPVTIRRSLGNEQPLDELSGAMLPRIC